MNNFSVARKARSLLSCSCLFMLILAGSHSLRAATRYNYPLDSSKFIEWRWQNFDWPTFRQSKSKSDVREVTAIQYLLRAGGFYKGKVDGAFGARTTAAVRAFQRANKLKVDGIVASQTFSHLVSPVKRGDRGDVVRALQILLPEEMGHYQGPSNPYLKVDGVFGLKTEQGVRRVQRDSLDTIQEEPVNGIVGPKMWWLLFGGENVGMS